ncbi:MAG: hypothetical protein HYT36_02670 [Candidatus Staskawiczbacteria bacterium]|nr:hypothetical protein [Candidatus Staskawiczbacteria bacterium]
MKKCNRNHGLALARLRFTENLRFQKKDKEVFTFAVKVDSGLLKKIRLGPESGVIRFMQKHEVTSIVDISNFNKAEGVSDRKTIAMFPYEKEAVAKAFALFS